MNYQILLPHPNQQAQEKIRHRTSYSAPSRQYRLHPILHALRHHQHRHNNLKQDDRIQT
jgi:hypothetical protein